MYIMERTIKDWKVTYMALNTKGEVEATIVIEDGKFENYILVPIIKEVTGKHEAIIFLLNWITVKLKGPVVSYKKPHILMDYGFEIDDNALVWRDDAQAII